MIRLKTTSKACHDVTPIRPDQPVNRLTDPLIVSRNFLVILTAVLVLIGSIGGSWLLVEPINEQREELQLTFSDEATRNMPPAAAIAQAALGSFRGVVVNFLWIRAQQLKQEGRFHEAVNLAHWIAMNQPRFPAVWEFLSWNMAYNHSVATHTPQERWLWVNRGIDILRGTEQTIGGLQYNPTNVQLHRQLGWTFSHKIGQYADDMHWYYKRKLAERWEAVLGQPPISDAHATRAWFAPVAEMDQRYFNVDQLDHEVVDQLDAAIAAHPHRIDTLRTLRVLSPRAFDRRAEQVLETVDPQRERGLEDLLGEAIRINRRTLELAAADPVALFLNDHPEAAGAVEQLRDWGFELNKDLLLLIGYQQMRERATWAARGPGWSVQPLDPNRIAPGLDADFDALARWATVSRWQDAEAARLREDVLLPFLRAKVLRQAFHMSPSFMLLLIDGRWVANIQAMAEGVEDPGEVGGTDIGPLPIDWRHPAAHGLYWSARGVWAGIPRRTRDETFYFQMLNTDRQTLHALQALMHMGRLVYQPLVSYRGQPAPVSYSADPRFIKAYDQAWYTSSQRIDPDDPMSGPRESFQAGHENFLKWAVRLQYFFGNVAEARDLYDRLDRLYGQKEGRDYTMPLRQFAMEEVAEDITSLNDAQVFIGQRIQQALIRWLLGGDATNGSAALADARGLYDYYQQEQARFTQGAEQARMGLPPFGDLLATNVVVLMYQRGLQVEQLAQIWNNLDLIQSGLQARLWPRVGGALRELVRQRFGPDVPVSDIFNTPEQGG